MGTVHSGTHIDAFSHITCGAEHEWFGGGSAERDLGDFGPLRGDATEIPPLIARGVLIDVAGARGVAPSKRTRRSVPRTAPDARGPGDPSCVAATLR